MGCIAAAAAIAGAAYGVWKLLERKNACCCCDCEDEPDFCEDFDLDSEDYDCDCDDFCDDLCCEETEEPAVPASDPVMEKLESIEAKIQTNTEMEEFYNAVCQEVGLV